MLWWDSCRLERGLPGPFPATLCVWRSLRFRSWPKAPTLLLLGDHLYTTAHPEGTSCVRQLLAAYTGTSVMALQRTAEAQLAPARFLPASSPPPRSLLGTFPAGTRAPVRLRDGQVGYLWQGEPSLPTSLQILATPRPHLGHTSAIPRPYLGHISGKASWPTRFGDGGDAEPRRVHLTMLVEKPTAEFAATNLAVPGLPEGTYLSAFGLYIITETGGLLRRLACTDVSRPCRGRVVDMSARRPPPVARRCRRRSRCLADRATAPAH